MTQTEALERFGKRTRLPQYKKCAALLAQNIRRGTGELITALGQEAENAFEEQKAAARRKAEEAQTKLLFPMLLMLSVVMILILRGSPSEDCDGPGKRCIERAVRNDK